MNMQTTPLSPAGTIEELPDCLREIVNNLITMNTLRPKRVRQVVIDANIEPEVLMPWSDFTHSAADSYGRRLVYDGGFFEMMVMSWCPGDVSAIHDHGYTEWGAVQIFGPAEHATFLVQDDEITCLSRTILKTGQAMAVGHQLVHQMGNTTQDQRFITFHLYGNKQRDHDITGNARVYDLNKGSIERTDGGVFHALPQHLINSQEPAPTPDYMCWLRNTVDIIKRVRIAHAGGCKDINRDLDQLVNDLFDSNKKDMLLTDLKPYVGSDGHAINAYWWKLLCHELTQAAALQTELQQDTTATNNDAFQTYAELYDAVIGQPCLDSFIATYLQFMRSHYNIDFSQSTLLSLGCGTGLTEHHMIEQLDIKKQNLLGIDISEAMIHVASQRIQAEIGDVMEIDPTVQTWDLAFCGLNIFQYLPHQHFADAIHKVAKAVKPGGYFFGDFITSDHIRWYPNLIFSEDQQIISLRTPQLIEKDQQMYQRSHILNIDFRKQMRITDEGYHQRFLPPLIRVRRIFEQAFNGAVDVYDAVSLSPVSADADTCPSTRYLVCARN
ncbi:MAG: methyltransferase domain-containing protein [Methylococcales bacterium]